jgi:predicted membrane-bound spermidine synthase
MDLSASPASAPAPGRWWFRAYLYLTAAVCGGAIMIVEILGTKMLAPYVGTSHFVWTAQIAVTLMALALGYYSGGRLASARHALRWLFAALALAGFYLLASVALCGPVAYAYLDLSLPVAALLTSTTLFFVPLGLLALTAPILVHTLTHSLAHVGPMVGRLTAFGTLGSFAGTLLAGYVLPLVPNSRAMSLLALLLVLLAAAYFLPVFRSAVQRAALLLLLGAAGFLTRAAILGDHWRGPANVELYRGNSFFGLIQVVQLLGGSQRFLLNDFIPHNGRDVTTGQSLFAFSYLMEGLARINCPRLDRVLCIGLGAGALPMSFAHTGSAVDVVEINPAIVPVARAWFGFQPEKVNLTLEDGRAFLNRPGPAYDAILLDAFSSDGAPSHLYTREAFAAMKARLRSGGTLVLNSHGVLAGRGDFLAASLFRTLSAVFARVQIFSNSTDFANVIFVASDRPPPPPGVTASLPVHGACLAEVQAALAAGPRAVDATHGQVLTDDFNPANYYDAPNRENMRRQLAARMRGV